MADGPADEPGGDREPHSDFLRGQFQEWMEHVVAVGRTRELFELEMWLRSFERYFRIRNQPLSEDSTRTLAIRSFYEEIGLVAHAIEQRGALPRGGMV